MLVCVRARVCVYFEARFPNFNYAYKQTATYYHTPAITNYYNSIMLNFKKYKNTQLFYSSCSMVRDVLNPFFNSNSQGWAFFENTFLMLMIRVSSYKGGCAFEMCSIGRHLYAMLKLA